MQGSESQLTLDGADRLHEALDRAGAPLAAAEAGRLLFALSSAPQALVRQLVDEVVRSDARFIWRSAGEVALAAWEEVRSLSGAPLENAPYVVFDLETTGTRPGSCAIVEIGAVRLQGFAEVATFERLVDPRRPIPARITRLTRIADRDVRGRPPVEPALRDFLAFSAGAVLVAHNARFDVGFVDAELSRLDGRRLAAPVLDTVGLARRLLRGRLESMALAVLAERFQTAARPCHRALPDARATAEVLLHLLGALQERGARTVAEAIALSGAAERRSRARRGLAAGMPPGPGVYLFRGRLGEVLYVGKAADLRARVRSYFGHAQLPRRVAEALEACERIEARPLGSEFEAALEELALIRRLRPPGNRRSARPERACYLTLTLDEPVPRLRVTSRAWPGPARSFGPLRSRAEAERAAAAARTALGLRVCRPAVPVDDGTCLAGLLGRCHAPCRGGEHEERYARALDAARVWLEGGKGARPAALLRGRMSRLASARRFEEAALVRDEIAALERVERTLAGLRTAVGRAGIVLAADRDDRFVCAFGCVGGRVLVRRRLPRAGDARLECDALLRALELALASRPPPLEPHEAEEARIVSSTLVRAPPQVRAISVDASTLAEARDRVAAARAAIPLRVALRAAA